MAFPFSRISHMFRHDDISTQGMKRRVAGKQIGSPVPARFKIESRLRDAIAFKNLAVQGHEPTLLPYDNLNLGE